jgi:hypothetical protein
MKIKKRSRKNPLQPEVVSDNEMRHVLYNSVFSTAEGYSSASDHSFNKC